MAHVRRATVGKHSLKNTHPFVHGRWLLVHNGHIGAFQVLRPKILEAIPQSHRYAIQGETDSEHIFRLILSLHEQQPKKPLLEILRTALQKVIDWSKEADPGSEVALNILLSNGEETVGSRYGRSLWYVERDKVHPCEVCTGEIHCHEIQERLIVL
jgi:glutamine amidotransferase